MGVVMWVVPHILQPNWSAFKGVFPEPAANAAHTSTPVPMSRPQVRLQK